MLRTALDHKFLINCSKIFFPFVTSKASIFFGSKKKTCFLLFPYFPLKKRHSFTLNYT